MNATPRIRFARPFLSACLVVFTACASVSLAAEVTAADARVAEVTVYADRAQVTRTATVDLQAGESTVVVPGLPWRVEQDSLRVRALGVPVAMGAVQLDEAAREPADSDEYREIEGEIESVERELALLAQNEATSALLRQYLRSMSGAPLRPVEEAPADPATDLELLRGIYDLMSEKLDALGSDEVARGEARRDLEEDLRVLRAKLQTLSGKGAIRFREARIAVDAEQAGRLRLNLTYVTPGASWRPAYEASLDADGDDVAWSAEGVVRQRTGESWEGVVLSLSTAAPAVGIDPPDLYPFYLRPYEPRQKRVAESMVMSEDAASPAKADDFFEGTPSPGREFAPQVEAKRAGAATVSTAYDVTFEVPGRATIPDDGREHRVLLYDEPLEATLEHVSAPSAVSAAYVVAKATAPEGRPTLAGALRVFAGGAYVGRTSLAETAQGGELELPFGIDKRVEVERVTLPREASREGFGGKDREVDYAWRTTLTNRRTAAIVLVVEERMPVAEDERIRVTMSKETTAGWVEDEERPGIVVWTLEIGAGESAEILFGYSVRHPKDLPVRLP